MIKPAALIVVAANSSWNILNFRRNLVRSLQEAGHRPVVLSPLDAGTDHRRGLPGVEWISTPIERAGLNPLKEARLLASYYAALRRITPAAFISFTIKPNIYGCMAARLLNIPAIPNISGLGTVFVRGGALMRLVLKMYRVALGAAPVVFFQNEEDMSAFLSAGVVRPDQARRLPGSGVDLERFSATPLPGGRREFLLVARMLSDKGIREFVEAARTLRSRGAGFTLLGPVDTGNPTAIAREEIEAWVSEGIVTYVPGVADVRPHIAAATVIVLPSYYKEGVPRSLLEGAAMGRPLITTDFPGCRDAVRDGSNGYLCAPRDPQALASAMGRMLDLSTEQLQAMGRASRQLAETSFDEGIVVAAYADALSKAGLERARPPARS